MSREHEDFRLHLAALRAEFPDRELISKRQFAAWLGLDYHTILRDSTIPTVRVGERNMITRTAAARWLSGGGLAR